MKVKIQKYNEEGSKVIGEEEKEVLVIVKFVGKTFFSFIDGKNYYVLGYDSAYFRIIDESNEDYLYLIKNPRPLNESSWDGKFELVEDFIDGEIKQIMNK